MYKKLANLLADSENSSFPWGSVILIVVFIALFIGMMILNRSSQKKKEEEPQNMLNAIKPGNKVKTIGGICGIVVEVCPEDNTFVLETGTEASGKSYIKFDKQAVYQTDAVPEAPAKKVSGKPVEAEEPVEEVAEETTVEETVEATPTETVEETNETQE